MAHFLSVKTFKDKRGSLSILEDFSLFPIKRVFFLYDVVDTRGGHRHKKTTQALICINGSCIVSVDNGELKKDYELKSPDQALILEPRDYHTMHNFSKGSVLLVLASENYDSEDYIHEAY